MDKREILLHCCCGPCAVACIDELRSMDFSVAACFINPNIHPAMEYLARLDSFEQLMAIKEVPIKAVAEYGLDSFLRVVPNSKTKARCYNCYQLRFMEVAALMRKMQIQLFTSTLLISPYQDQTAIRQAGFEAADGCDVEFFFHDFRPLFREGQCQARDLGLYMQKYCGCIYSEAERYEKKLKKHNKPSCIKAI